MSSFSYAIVATSSVPIKHVRRSACFGRDVRGPQIHWGRIAIGRSSITLEKIKLHSDHEAFRSLSSQYQVHLGVHAVLIGRTRSISTSSPQKVALRINPDLVALRRRVCSMWSLNPDSTSFVCKMVNRFEGTAFAKHEWDAAQAARQLPGW